MPIMFKELVRHDGLQLAPAVSTAFEDPNAEDYFVAAGWADTTTDEAAVTYPAGSITVDPNTIFSDGKQVLQPKAATSSAARKGK